MTRHLDEFGFEVEKESSLAAFGREDLAIVACHRVTSHGPMAGTPESELTSDVVSLMLETAPIALCLPILELDSLRDRPEAVQTRG